jgi:hypothetical protein
MFHIQLVLENGPSEDHCFLTISMTSLHLLHSYSRLSFFPLIQILEYGLVRTKYSLDCSPFSNLVCEAIGTTATPGLLRQPRVIVMMIVEKQMECRLAGETKFSEKTCSSATFVHHKIPHDQTRV